MVCGRTSLSVSDDGGYAFKNREGLSHEEKEVRGLSGGLKLSPPAGP